MRQIIIFFILALACFQVKAQTPVHWNWSAQKSGENQYLIKLTATIDEGWHLYSQTQPADAIAIPTTILFNKNPVTKMSGKPKELGRLQKHKEKTLDIEQWQYADKVEFVQTVQVKNNIKTNLSGSIKYQVCTDEKCLPPKTVKFNLNLN